MWKQIAYRLAGFQAIWIKCWLLDIIRRMIREMIKRIRRMIKLPHFHSLASPLFQNESKNFSGSQTWAMLTLKHFQLATFVCNSRETFSLCQTSDKHTESFTTLTFFSPFQAISKFLIGVSYSHEHQTMKSITWTHNSRALYKIIIREHNSRVS